MSLLFLSLSFVCDNSLSNMKTGVKIMIFFTAKKKWNILIYFTNKFQLEVYFYNKYDSPYIH